MPTLIIENVPGEIYEQIQRQAEEDNRSLSEEVIQLLRQKLKQREPQTTASAVEVKIADSPRLPCPPILDTGEMSPPCSLPRSGPGVEVPTQPGGKRQPTSFDFGEEMADNV